MFVVTHELKNMKTFRKTVCVSLYLQMRSDLEEKFGDQFNLALLNQTLNRPILSLSKLYDSTVHWNIKSSLKCILNFNVEFCLKGILQSIRINFRKRLKGIKHSNSACWQEPQKVTPPVLELVSSNGSFSVPPQVRFEGVFTQNNQFCCGELKESYIMHNAHVLAH